MKTSKNKLVHWFIIGTFVSLYLMVSIISTIHVVSFFELSNYRWLAISLAIAFEVGAAASLASLVVMEKMNKTIVWALFWTLTLFQAMGNTYYAYDHLEGYQSWIELFGLMEENPIAQKRILAIISGAILPLVSLGFIKSLTDYLKPDPEKVEEAPEEVIEYSVDEEIEEAIAAIQEKKKSWDENIKVDSPELLEDPVEEIIEEEILENPDEPQENPDEPVNFFTKKPIKIKEKGKRNKIITEYRKEEIAKQENKGKKEDKYNKDGDKGLSPEFHNPQE